MCSIAGVSFASNSTINRRQLANRLLTAGEARGRDASGFAFVAPDGDGIFKKPVRGSQLHLGSLPQTATSMILHTRASTQGSPRYNENNHPVESTSGNIRLVHNGVIYNDDEVRRMFDKRTQKQMAEVDSAVIPEVIDTFGVGSTDVLAGYAAAAWFDKETGDTIHLARFTDAPVVFATLADGTFVFASTAKMLADTFRSLDLSWFGSYPDPFEELGNGEYVQLIDGVAYDMEKVGWNDDYYYSGYNWRGVTSGATTRRTSTGTPGNGASGHVWPTVMGSAPSKGSEDKPMALTTGSDAPGETILEGLSEQEYDDMVSAAISDIEADFNDDPEYDDTDTWEPLYYTKGHDGDYVTYTSLATLTSSLRWHAALSGGEDHLVGPDEGNVRWVNHFADVGHLSGDQKEERSWVNSAEAMAQVYIMLPAYVRDGVEKLRTLVGS